VLHPNMTFARGAGFRCTRDVPRICGPTWHSNPKGFSGLTSGLTPQGPTYRQALDQWPNVLLSDTELGSCGADHQIWCNGPRYMELPM